jgi:hypothetical protein
MKCLKLRDLCIGIDGKENSMPMVSSSDGLCKKIRHEMTVMFHENTATYS